MSAPEHATDVREWLNRALDDLRWARHSLSGGFLPQACFGCQQAVEKTLKAYLLAHDWPLRRTHSLPDLLREAAEFDGEADQFRDSALVLDAYYAPTRYADTPVSLDYTEARVQDAIERTASLVSWFKLRIERRLAPDGPNP